MPGGVLIEDGCFVGSGAVLHEGIKVGENAVISAGQIVATDVAQIVGCADCKAVIKGILGSGSCHKSCPQKGGAEYPTKGRILWHEGKVQIVLSIPRAFPLRTKMCAFCPQCGIGLADKVKFDSSWT